MSHLQLATIIVNCVTCAILIATLTDARAFARQLRREDEQRAQQKKEREQ